MLAFLRKNFLNSFKNLHSCLARISAKSHPRTDTLSYLKNLSRNSGQVALIMILIIAISIIFLAVTMNMGKIAEIKTLVTVASNTSAAMMASLMASHAEMMYQVQLGGPDETQNELSNCGWSGVIGAIFKFIVIVLKNIGRAIMKGPAGVVEAIIDIGAATFSLALKLVVIEPGITDLLNSKVKRVSKADQFIESGIQVAMQNVVDDNEKIPDTIDLDEDGLSDFGNTKDWVTRYSYAYAKRLDGINKKPVIDAKYIREFKNALGEFLYRAHMMEQPCSPYIYNDCGPTPPRTYCDPVTDPNRCIVDDGWGLWDPVGMTCFSDPQNGCCRGDFTTCSTCTDEIPKGCCSNDKYLNFTQCAKCDASPTQECCTAAKPGECNSCCLPKGGNCDAAGKNCEPNIRPTCCDAAMDSCGTASTCPNTYFPWVYDRHFEDAQNTFVSFREFLGHDDESRFLINGLPDFQKRFRMQDSRGMYSFNWMAINADLRTSSAQPPLWTPDPADNHCFWCDPRVGTSTGYDCDANNSFVRLDPFTSACTAPNLNYDNCCVPLNTDRVTDVVGMRITTEQCYKEPTFSGPWWKEGVNKFCSTHYPYDICPGEVCADPGDPTAGCLPGTCCYCTQEICPPPPLPPPLTAPCCQKENPVCPQPPPPGPEQGLWVADEADAIRYGIDDFITWAKSILGQDVQNLVASFESWYPEADRYLSNLDTGNPDLKQRFPGKLNLAAYLIDQWNYTITVWRESDQYGGIAGDSCYPGGPPATIPEVRDCVLGLRNVSAAGSDDWYKYDARYRFLRDIYLESGRIADGLLQANRKIVAFINDLRVTKLKLEFGAIRAATAVAGTWEPFAIYGWRTKENPDDPNSKKYWHLVRADAKLPGRCGGKCGRGYYGKSREPTWPYLFTFTKDWGTRRCWSMVDSLDYDDHCNDESDYAHDARACMRGGTVKSRVIRWDQDRDFMMKFANNVPIWNFMFHHPGVRSTQSPQAAIQALETSCANNNTIDYFMYNGGRDCDPNNPPPPPAVCENTANQDACYNAARNLLQRGVMSKTCAEYFFHQVEGLPVSVGFSVKFADHCDFN